MKRAAERVAKIRICFGKHKTMKRAAVKRVAQTKKGCHALGSTKVKLQLRKRAAEQGLGSTK